MKKISQFTGCLFVCLSVCMPAIAGFEFRGTGPTTLLTEEFCAQAKTVKDCAELACHWIDSEGRCADKPNVEEAPVTCENYTSPERCEANYRCYWDWWECVDRE